MTYYKKQTGKVSIWKKTATSNNSHQWSFTNTNNTQQPSTLPQYLLRIQTAINSTNGKSFANLLAFRSISISNKTSILKSNDSTMNRTCNQYLTNPWSELLTNYLKSARNSILIKNKKTAWLSSQLCCTHMHNNIIRPTIDTSNSVSNELSADNVWYLPCINIVLKQFTDYAIAYHQYLQSNVDTADNDIIVVAFGQVMQIIRDMTADHTNRSISQNLNGRHSLSHGLFFTVNKIIKLCDIVNNQTYLNHALQEVQKFRSIWATFPLSDVVTHLYYAGRFNISRDELTLAFTDLKTAFKLCPNETLNKIRILLLLIPLQIIHGYLPNSTLILKKYMVYDQFYPLIHAIRNGNILLFRSHLLFYEDSFINCGIYLLLERLEFLVYRSLIQKMYVVRLRMYDECKQNVLPFEKPHIISLSDILKAIQIQNKIYFKMEYYQKYGSEGMDGLNDVCMDEIECVLANLICKKIVKGYIAHGQAVVLNHKSLKSAFPSIKEQKNWWKNDFLNLGK